MNIAIDIRHLATKYHSGVGHYTLCLIRELAKESPNTKFILFASGAKNTIKTLPVFHQKNISVFTKNIPNRILSLLLLLRIRTLESFLPEKPDYWFFPNINIAHTKIPFILTVHDMSFDFLKDVFTRKQLLWHYVARPLSLVKNASVILSVSLSTKQDLIERWNVKPSKIIVAPLGVTNDFHARHEPSDRTFLNTYKINFPYFLHMATIEPRKNLESIIEAYNIWRKKLNTNQIVTRLVIAGSLGWKTRTLIQKINTSPYAKDIHLLGYVKDSHRPALLRHAIAFIFPSYWEGFGLPTLEAMASGVPVIASFTGALPEVVGDSGILIDPFVVTDLVEALSLVEDPKIQSNFSKLGLIRAQQFSWSNTARITLEAFENLYNQSK